MKQKNYVAYLRQSTMKQEISGLGVEAQREIMRNYLKDKKRLLNILKRKAGENPTDLNLLKLWSYAEKRILS